MKLRITKHIPYYIGLITIFTVGLLFSIALSPNIFLQALTVVVTITLYMAWGILHHYRSHELTKKIMIEYVLIGILGLSMIFFIFMGGVGI